jgi:hypothetical protein
LKVQVTVWPVAEQVQLSPENPLKVSSGGSVSVTVIGDDATPAAGSFCTLMM